MRMPNPGESKAPRLGLIFFKSKNNGELRNSLEAFPEDFSVLNLLSKNRAAGRSTKNEDADPRRVGSPEATGLFFKSKNNGKLRNSLEAFPENLSVLKAFLFGSPKT